MDETPAERSKRTYDTWEQSQKLSPASPEAYYAELAWNAALEYARTQLDFTPV